MSRLILVPQYPTRLRYQEWWFTELPKNYTTAFDEVLTLGQGMVNSVQAFGEDFSPMQEAIEFETQQIREYLALELRQDDVLLLCDISYPGLFGHVLFHKRPTHCFAICHATSKNRLDYFHKDRKAKWRVETGLRKLFNTIFVATKYHQEKLGWGNTFITGLPLPPRELHTQGGKTLRFPYGGEVVSVARSGVQKRNETLEKYVEKNLGIKIIYPETNDWKNYYSFLSESKVMLITAKEETFGYQVVDALLNDCIPIAPNAFSYPELLHRDYLYKDAEELIVKVKAALAGTLPPPKLLNREICVNFFENTARLMKKGVKQ